MNVESEIKVRERSFHDDRFSNVRDPREKLTKYYSITTDSKNCYRQLIESHLTKNSNVLEYGCGTADDVEFYKALGCHYYGIDISSEAIRRAEERAKANGLLAKYFVGDAENTNFEPNSFDVVFGSGILHHLNLGNSIKELSRILDRKGRCVFLEPLGHNLIINLFRYFTPKSRSADEHPLVDKDVEAMKIYFRKVDVTYFYCFSLGAVLFRNSSLFGKVYGGLSAIDKYLMKRFSWFGKYCWICVICLSEPRKA